MPANMNPSVPRHPPFFVFSCEVTVAQIHRRPLIGRDPGHGQPRTIRLLSLAVSSAKVVGLQLMWHSTSVRCGATIRERCEVKRTGMVYFPLSRKESFARRTDGRRTRIGDRYGFQDHSRSDRTA